MCEITKWIFPRHKGFYYQILKPCCYIFISPTASFIQSLKKSAQFLDFQESFISYTELASVHTPASGWKAQQMQAKLISFLLCVGHVSVLLMRNTPGLCRLLNRELSPPLCTVAPGTQNVTRFGLTIGEQRLRPHLSLWSSLLDTWPQQQQTWASDMQQLDSYHETNATHASSHPHLPSTIQISQHPKCGSWKFSPMKNIAPCHNKNNSQKTFKVIIIRLLSYGENST